MQVIPHMIPIKVSFFLLNWSSLWCPEASKLESERYHIHLCVTVVCLFVCFSHLLPDKAEGNKFAKDFEDNTEKLQEFVAFLDKELKTAPPLLEALGNADIFYEMQYKEVKIVANVSVGFYFVF